MLLLYNRKKKTHHSLKNTAGRHNPYIKKLPPFLLLSRCVSPSLSSSCTWNGSHDLCHARQAVHQSTTELNYTCLVNTVWWGWIDACTRETIHGGQSNTQLCLLLWLGHLTWHLPFLKVDSPLFLTIDIVLHSTFKNLFVLFNWNFIPICFLFCFINF